MLAYVMHDLTICGEFLQFKNGTHHFTQQADVKNEPGGQLDGIE